MVHFGRTAKWLLALLGAGTLAHTGVFDEKAGVSERSEQRMALSRLRDGSNVLVTVLEENLEVLTRYGRLKVPVAEVHKIEFGLRIADLDAKKIDQTIKLLSSGDFDEREGAVKNLVTYGIKAIPPLQSAAKSADAELKERAKMALREIEVRTPVEDLPISMEDRVHTPGFTVVGHIVSQTLKVKSAYFGMAELKLSDLRSLQWQDSPGTVEVTVDAGKYGSAPDQWMDTGILIDSGTDLEIAATGQVDLWSDGSGQYVTGPKGYQGGGSSTGFLPGALLGKLAESGSVFLIGERYQGSQRESGKLYIRIVPSPWNNPSVGSYKIKITVKG